MTNKVQRFPPESEKEYMLGYTDEDFPHHTISLKIMWDKSVNLSITEGAQYEFWIEKNGFGNADVILSALQQFIDLAKKQLDNTITKNSDLND